MTSPKHSFNKFFSYLKISLFSMPPFHCKGSYVSVLCNSCTVKYLSHVALKQPRGEKKANQKPSSLNKDTCILVTFTYNCNFQGNQTLITTQFFRGQT